LTAPRSASRHSAVWATSASGAGLVSVLRIGLSSGSWSNGMSNCGGAMSWAIRPESSCRAPIWKSASSGPRDLVADEVFQGLSSCPANQLSDQVPEVERVIARRGARLPPRRLGREQRGGLVPAVEVLDRDRLLPAGDA
jgi:hypothetical protein